MRNTPEDAARLERKFKSCQKVLTALGDPTRQHLICIMPVSYTHLTLPTKLEV